MTSSTESLYNSASPTPTSAASCNASISLTQTFTTNATYVVSKVKLKLYRVGNPGTATVGVRETVGGVAVGSDLSTGTLNVSAITTDTAGAYYEFDMSPYGLQRATTYALVLRTDATAAANQLYWIRGGEGFVPITPVDISPAVGAWVDVDVSSYVPSGATGVILHILQKTGTSRAVGLRKNGSTDNVTKELYITQHLWAMVGVDSNRIFEVYTNGLAQDNQFWLVGYTGAAVTFFDNMQELSVTPHSYNPVFETIDLSAMIPSNAVGVVLELWTDAISPVQDSGTDPAHRSNAVRETGSTDDYSGVLEQMLGCYHSWAIIGVNATQNIDVWHTGTWRHTAVIGYITGGATLFVNGVNKTPNAGGVWTSVDYSVEAPNASMLFFEMRFDAADYDPLYGVRQAGSSENIYKITGPNHDFAFVAGATNQTIQYKKAVVGIEIGPVPQLYLMGYVPQATGATAPFLYEVWGKGSGGDWLGIIMTTLLAMMMGGMAFVISKNPAWSTGFATFALPIGVWTGLIQIPVWLLITIVLGIVFAIIFILARF